MRILGIDPGLRTLGWGVIESHGSKLHHVENGICKSGEGVLADRLLALHIQLTDVIARLVPENAAKNTSSVRKETPDRTRRGLATISPSARIRVE